MIDNLFPRACFLEPFLEMPSITCLQIHRYRKGRRCRSPFTAGDVARNGDVDENMGCSYGGEELVRRDSSDDEVAVRLLM